MFYFLFCLLAVYEFFALGFVFGCFSVDEEFCHIWDYPPFRWGAYLIAPILLWYAIGYNIKKMMNKRS